MRDGPDITSIAALVGDHARAEVLTALMSGMAPTATELAKVAGVTKQTISGHLAKLVEARLLAVEAQGRHRYFRRADADVARLLESLMSVAFRTGALRLRSSPREPALRKARACYDHLAGELGVMVYDRLAQASAFTVDGDGIVLTAAGRRLVAGIGVDLDALASTRRPLCRTCLDWSERRHHLAGALGSALMARYQQLGWASRVKDSRVMAFSSAGEQALRAWCECPADAAAMPAIDAM
jgi:DNA-binding transcriptional ArsR family regulator